MKRYKCIINKVIYEEGDSLVEITSGVKERNQWKYALNKGGFGTYVTGFHNTPSRLEIKIFICELNKYVYLDIKEEVLRINNRKRITKKLVNILEEQNEGERIWFDFSEDYSIIKNKENFEKLNLIL